MSKHLIVIGEHLPRPGNRAPNRRLHPFGGGGVKGSSKPEEEVARKPEKKGRFKQTGCFSSDFSQTISQLLLTDGLGKIKGRKCTIFN